MFNTEDIVTFEGRKFTLGRRCGVFFHAYEITNDASKQYTTWHLRPEQLKPHVETIDDGQTIEI